MEAVRATPSGGQEGDLETLIEEAPLPMRPWLRAFVTYRTDEEIAVVRGVSTSTVRRWWGKCLRWLTVG